MILMMMVGWSHTDLVQSIFIRDSVSGFMPVLLASVVPSDTKGNQTAAIDNNHTNLTLSPASLQSEMPRRQDSLPSLGSTIK